MASTSSMKVSPINDEVEAEIGLQAIDGIITYEEPNTDEHAAQHYQEEPQNLKLYLRKKTLASRAEAVLSTLTYDNAKWAMRWFLESATFKINLTFEDLTLLMTLFVLFGDDIKLLCAAATDDNRFAAAYAVCFFTFIFEIVANTWTKTTIISWYPKPSWKGYLFSFFWFLDVIAIASLFPDIPFVGGPMGISGISNDVSGGSDYTKAGRVVRLVRLVRLVKLYKVAAERRLRNQQEEELMELVRVGVLKYEDIAKQRALYNQGQSRLGDQLSESTTRRVIIMILIMLIILPLLLYFPENTGREFSVRMLHNFNINPSVGAAAQQVTLDTFLQSMQDNYNNRYVDYLQVTPLSSTNPYVYFEANLKGLRDAARFDESLTTTIGSDVYTTYTVFNLTSLVRQNATFSILMTIFVAIMMVGGSLVFTNDAETLVIAPIERMMNMVEAVARDPLATLHFDHDTKSNQAGQYETRLLESTIEKITGLLRVGFGEAGAGIISANLSSKDSSAAINPLLPGMRIYAIFGFCDIHHFEDINRLLEKDVLTFVNHIAEIVHSSVHAWSGQCNKNLGNAFVIVWRIGDEHTLTASMAGNRIRGSSTVGAEMMSTKTPGSLKMNSVGSDPDEQTKKKAAVIDLRRVPGVDILADQALIGYCKIIAEINRNKYVMRYRNEPRLTEGGTHDFKVRMGFGLHAGWAIEGAVGSLQKVDATYLSPHVNMAARLETSSKQYGVPLLASQDFYDLLSNDGQSVMRRLDVVTVKGSEVPIGIFTYDALQDQFFQQDAKRQRPSAANPNDPGAPANLVSPMMSTRNGGSLKMLMNGSILGGTPVGKPKAADPPMGFDDAPASGNGTPQRRPSVTQAPAFFLTPQDQTGDVFEQDYDMLTLRKHATDPEFLNIFREGINLYLAGDWQGAKVLLEKSNTFMANAAPSLGGDGPSLTLLDYMRNQNFEAPSTWKGFRPLTSK